MKKPFLVIAGNHNQFRDWVRAHKINSVNDAVYITSLDQIIGRREDDFVLVGTYWESSMFKYHLEELELIDRNIRKKALQY